MNDLDRIRAIPITRILGLPHTTRRLQMKCPMPNHNDSSPSFTLYSDGSFHCFGCDANGQNAVDFALYINGASDTRMVSKQQFKKAVNDLRDYL